METQDERIASIRPGVAEALVRLENGLETASPRLRAGVLVLSNHILRMVARVWGRDVVDNPRNARGDILVPLGALLHSRIEAGEVMEWTGRNEANLRQCLSIDNCISTVGYGVMPLNLGRISGVWRTLWGSREHMSEALINMRDWELERGVSSMPRDDNGDYPDDADALKCGNGFPMFLRTGNRRR